jgi:nitroimidazol reductase NimA-like FMN-containing flavoprotein (pyridoxamine 5'-phosphate oxidase superfamily)
MTTADRASTPVTDLDPRYSDSDAPPVPWDTTRHALTGAELSWLTTVRPDGRPHVTPLITVSEGATTYFCTGADERKRRNLAENPHVALTTGANSWDAGLDVVVEGDAERVTDEAVLRRLADALVAKYGDVWRFDVGNGSFLHVGTTDEAWVYAVRPRTVFAFGKAPHTQTRYRFADA